MTCKIFKKFLSMLLGTLGLELKRKSVIPEIKINKFNLDSLRSVCFNDFCAASIKASSLSDSIIIIGAIDLVSFDSLSKYLRGCRSKVFCFEPRRSSFKQLSDNIERLGLSTIVPVNKAIHPSLQECTIYDISSDYILNYPKWAQGIASFSKSYILRHVQEEHIKTELVECSNPDNWLLEFGISSISYLQISTEGYDYEILKYINLFSSRPKAIMLRFVSLSEEEKNECCAYLSDHGYDLMFNGEDLLAVNLSRILG